MAVKFNFKQDRLFTIACIIFMMCAFSFSAAAQRIRLRANINPACTTTVTNAKFADIYADGNIAVQGTYGCTGVFIYDISNPNAPVVASRYNPGNNLQFLEAIVIGNRGYFGSGNGGGVHIVDLTNPASPVLLGIVNSANGTGYNSIHEIVIRGKYLIENFNGTSTRPLKIIDVSNPAAAVLKWTFLNTTPTAQEEAVWVHAYHIRGNRLFTSGWGSGSNRGKTTIYDISDLDNQPPLLLGSIEDTSSTTAGNSMHSSWSSEDGNYVYSCRETSSGADLRVYDIHNPAVPLLIKKITMAQLNIVAISPHNPVVMGNKLYVSWYQAGLVMFDISDPADPKMIGQYDTWPQEFSPNDSLAQKRLESEPWDMICANLGRGTNQAVGGFDGDWAVFPFLGEDKVLIGDLATGLYIVDVSSKNRVSDFDGDGKTDYSKYTPASGTWEIQNSSNQADAITQFGLNGDKLTSGDYDGDGKSDIAVWRPSSGVWYSLDSTNGVFRANQFGISEDIPEPGDYDGDGKTDIAVWRPSSGVWYLYQSTQGVRIFQWGMTGDKPLTGDFDGDGKSDAVIYRGGSWYVLKSSTGAPSGAFFGLADDKPLAGDFDGDAKADYAVYRPSTGTWYVFRSTINNFTAITFGISTDMPIPADYDGDGKADYAVYRPADGNWHILRSSDNGYMVKNFGSGSDIPSPSSINP
jgi:hypothetical protein